MEAYQRLSKRNNWASLCNLFKIEACGILISMVRHKSGGEITSGSFNSDMPEPPVELGSRADWQLFR